MQDLTGLTFSSFKIEKRIAIGGFSVVYRATKEGDEVALKLLLRGWLRHNHIRQGFLREGEIASRMNHSNIVRHLESGEIYNKPFHVMEYINGVNLANYRIEGCAVDRVKNVREILAQIGQAVQHVHSQGVVHRDISSHNILIDENKSVRLIDFGSAIDIQKGSSAVVTSVHGNPRFIAPEIKIGGTVSILSDIYSLGVLARGLLGRLWGGELRLAPLEHALSEDPASRPQSAIEFITALDSKLERLVNG